MRIFTRYSLPNEMGQKTFRTDGFSGSDPEYICQGFERGDSGVTKFREEGFSAFRHPGFTRLVPKITPKG